MYRPKQKHFDFLYKHTGEKTELDSQVQYILSNINKHYYREEVQKVKGVRIIDKPSDQLKAIQRKILKAINTINEERGIVSKQVFGLGGNDVKQNILPHKKNRYIFKIDIKNFFNSINYKKVKRIFINFGCCFESSEILTKLTTYNYYIPQGVPTSSILASIYLKNCDRRIEILCTKLNMVYTRYADDITISGKNKITNETVEHIKSIISQEGLKMNEKTEIVDTQNKACRITGIILQNNRVITKYHHGQEKHEFIRSNIPIKQNKENRQLHGVLRWIKSIDPGYYNILIIEGRCPHCH